MTSPTRQPSSPGLDAALHAELRARWCVRCCTRIHDVSEAIRANAAPSRRHWGRGVPFLTALSDNVRVASAAEGEAAHGPRLSTPECPRRLVTFRLRGARSR